MEIKSEKMVESPLSFFQSYNKCFISKMVFILVKSHSISPICLQCIMKKALLLHQFCKASFDHLFDNLKSGKILNYSCFGKNSGKSLEFWIEKSVRTQLRVMINSCSKSCLFVLRCL